jgi:hypothetical protein
MDAPSLEFVFEIIINVGNAFDIGDTGNGIRKIIPLLGGTFKGPGMSGIILPGGADWQLIRQNDVADVNARYILQTDDGALIYLCNSGIRVASREVLKKLANGEIVDPDAYYFRTSPAFETADSKYSWLMKHLFIAKGIRYPDKVNILVWKVL